MTIGFTSKVRAQFDYCMGSPRRRGHSMTIGFTSKVRAQYDYWVHLEGEGTV